MTNEQDRQDILESLDKSLQRIANCLGFISIQMAILANELDDKTAGEKSVLLKNLGFETKEIASVLDTSPSSVRGLISSAKKSEKKTVS